MKYHFYSKSSGEIVHGLRDVIRTIFSDLIHYKFFNIRWEYSKEGF